MQIFSQTINVFLISVVPQILTHAMSQKVVG